jgi:PAS domain S-box-containing protein
MAIAIRALVVADSERAVGWLTEMLRELVYTIELAVAGDEAQCAALLSQQHWDAMVCVFEGGRAPAALRALADADCLLDPPLIFVADSFEQVAEVAQRESASVCLRANGAAHLALALERAAREQARREEQNAAAAFDQGQRAVLEHIAAGRALRDVLDEIVLLIERQEGGMMCSILMLDRATGRVRHGAAPHLPQALVSGIDGALIGPHEGSCGAAAYLGRPVIVEDIDSHPNWASYKHLVVPAGLLACWSSPIRSGPEGEVLGTFAMYYRQARGPTDSERKWVERASHLAALAISRERSEHALRMAGVMYAAVGDILFYLGVEGDGCYRFLSINPAFTQATGLSEAAVIGRTVAEVIPEPSLSLVLTRYAQAIRERRTLTWDEITPYPAGKKYGEVSIAPLFDADGVCTNLVGTVHDVTQRRLAEERVAAQAALLDIATDAIMVRDVDGGIRYWNKGAERLYGWTSDEVLGRPVAGLLYRDTSGLQAAIDALFATDRWSGELVHFTKQGRQITIDASWTLVRDEHGKPQSILAINSDITERKSLEAQVFHSQRLESLGMLAGGVAHDFNNLLMAILCNVTLAENMLNEKHPMRALLADVTNASNRGAALVRQLLTFSRRQESSKRLTKLAPVAAEALGLLRAAIPSKIRIETSFEPGAPDILADPTQIHQIVMNLGTNAAHAIGSRGGSIQLRVERVVLDRDLSLGSTLLHKGSYSQLVVADTGEGMDAATIDHIFDPFFTTKAPGEGTGLGLSVVHGIVKKHEGGIAVHSALGHGTEFRVYFPAAPAPQRGRA